MHACEHRRGTGFPGAGVTGVVSSPMGVLGTQLWSSERSACVLNHRAISPDPRHFLKNISNSGRAFSTLSKI